MTTTITIQITAQAPDPMTAQAAIRLALAALSPAQPQTIPPPAPPHLGPVYTPPTEKEEPRNGDSPKPATSGLPDLDKIDMPPHYTMKWLNSGEKTFNQLHTNEQIMVAKHFLATLINSRDPGAPARPTVQEWDDAKPAWMPAAKHIPALVGATWRAWVTETMNEMATDDLFPQP